MQGVISRAIKLYLLTNNNKFAGVQSEFHKNIWLQTSSPTEQRVQLQWASLFLNIKATIDQVWHERVMEIAIKAVRIEVIP